MKKLLATTALVVGIGFGAQASDPNATLEQITEIVAAHYLEEIESLQPSLILLDEYQVRLDEVIAAFNHIDQALPDFNTSINSTDDVSIDNIINDISNAGNGLRIHYEDQIANLEAQLVYEEEHWLGQLDIVYGVVDDAFANLNEAHDRIAELEAEVQALEENDIIQEWYLDQIAQLQSVAEDQYENILHLQEEIVVWQVATEEARALLAEQTAYFEETLHRQNNDIIELQNIIVNEEAIRNDIVTAYQAIEEELRTELEWAAYDIETRDAQIVELTNALIELQQWQNDAQWALNDHQIIRDQQEVQIEHLEEQLAAAQADAQEASNRANVNAQNATAWYEEAQRLQALLDAQE